LPERTTKAKTKGTTTAGVTCASTEIANLIVPITWIAVLYLTNVEAFSQKKTNSRLKTPAAESRND
jgi:hypothetical protein